MSRFAAIEQKRAAIMRALALGAARQPIEIPEALQRERGDAGDTGALGLVAVLAVRGRFDRATLPDVFAPPPPIPDRALLLDDAARSLLCRVTRDRRQRGFAAVYLRLLDVLRERKHALHPFDYPQLTRLMNADATALDQAALAWWQANQSTAREIADYDDMTAANWTEFGPAARERFLRRLRGDDPAAARELCAGAIAEDTASVRARLVGALATGLSADDAGFLEDLDSDRAASVRRVATSLLARIPGTSAYSERLATAQELLRVRSALSIGKRRIVEMKFPKGLAQGKRDEWVAETFDAVDPTVLAGALGLAPKQFAAAVGESTLGQVLFVNALHLDEFEMAALLAAKLDLDSGLAWAGRDRLQDLAPEQAKALWRCLIDALPTGLSSAAVLLDQVYQCTRAPIPDDAGAALAQPRRWRRWLAELGDDEADHTAQLEVLAALTPASSRAALRKSLKKIPPASSTGANTLAELLDLLEQH